MKSFIYRRCGCLFTALIILLTSVMYPVEARAATEPQTVAVAAILYDVETGKVLYDKNSSVRMYPGSLTKILTAIVLLQHFSPYETVVCGSEINAIPGDSSKAGHVVGETLTVENLLRGLIIPSGNETANVVAYAVAKRVLGDDTISYTEAEKWFCNEMNRVAKELGALDTNFVNPHGYHSASHYTTAYDMAIISAEAMKNDLIRDTAGEVSFSGSGAGTNQAEISKNYNWTTHNEIIMPSSPYYYPYATGIKTGFHNEGGYCLSASATKDGRELIAIVLNAQIPGRWIDSKELFDYGFNNFAHEVIQEGDIILGEIELSNTRLGDPIEIEYLAKGSKTDLLSKDQVSRIVREITFLPELIAELETDPVTGKIDRTERLKTPIEEGQVIGSVNYTLDGDLLFSSELVAVSTALERSFNTDVDYYLELWKKRAMSPYAVPVYTGIVILLFIIIKLISSAKKRRYNTMYRTRRRY